MKVKQAEMTETETEITVFYRYAVNPPHSQIGGEMFEDVNKRLEPFGLKAYPRPPLLPNGWHPLILRGTQYVGYLNKIKGKRMFSVTFVK